MNIGESVSAVILAKEKWNNTGINLIANQEYHLTASASEKWVDWFILCNADGFPSSNWILKNTERLRRVPDENWFALIGAINFDSGNLFKIGTDKKLQPTQSGILTCFANDIPFMYWNNKGSIQLVVTRIK
ncbi:hypothetical protein [Rivularia sp. PCC 7116]|uniref:hypothetical protein n=1 Tax=Rivularia sp. PCC 7116 TaxID=373994 RepID=UPI000306E488|nr:hypothetical protein [Rivularia sp. PCC 7116]